MFEDLLHEVKNPAIPDAICRHEKCSQINQGDLLPARSSIFQVN